MRPRKIFAPVAHKATVEATTAHGNEMTDNSAMTDPQAQPASDHDTKSRGSAHHDHPSAEGSTNVDPARTRSEETDDLTGSTEAFLRSTSATPRDRNCSETSQEASPGRRIPGRIGLNAALESLLEDQDRSGTMLGDSIRQAAETLKSVLNDALLDDWLLAFGWGFGRRMGRREETKTAVESQIKDLRAEMDKAWSSIEEGRACGRGFDAIECDLKRLVKAREDIDEAVQDAEKDFKFGSSVFAENIQSTRRNLARA